MAGLTPGRDTDLAPPPIGMPGHVQPDGRARYSGGAWPRQSLRCAQPTRNRPPARQRLLHAAPRPCPCRATRNPRAAFGPAACARASHPPVEAGRHQSGTGTRALRAQVPFFYVDLTGVPAATTSSPGGGARDVRAPPPAEIRRVQVNSGMIDNSIWCAAAPDPPIRFRSRALGLARARLASSSRLTPNVSPRSACAEMSLGKCTRSFILVQDELKPPGSASGGQQGAQKAAASAASAIQARSGRSSGLRFASRCRCGAREAARGGAIRSHPARYACKCVVCAVACPLCSSR